MARIASRGPGPWRSLETEGDPGRVVHGLASVEENGGRGQFGRAAGSAVGRVGRRSKGSSEAALAPCRPDAEDELAEELHQGAVGVGQDRPEPRGELADQDVAGRASRAVAVEGGHDPGAQAGQLGLVVEPDDLGVGLGLGDDRRRLVLGRFELGLGDLELLLGEGGGDAELSCSARVIWTITRPDRPRPPSASARPSGPRSGAWPRRVAGFFSWVNWASSCLATSRARTGAAISWGGSTRVIATARISIPCLLAVVGPGS